MSIPLTELKLLLQASYAHNAASGVSICYQIFTMILLTKGSEDITSDHLADIAVLFGSCTNVISNDISLLLGEIAACIRNNGKTEDFDKIEPARGIDWLQSNCPLAAEKLQTFFDKHGHRGLQEMDFLSEPWILQPDNVIAMIKV